MKVDREISAIVHYWMEKARDALASAGSEFSAGRYSFAMNRAYYACFYAASAVLLNNKRRFSKHSGVRSAVHQYLVKTGQLQIEFGKIYDRLFENRQEGDYLELVKFEEDQIRQALHDAGVFVLEMQKIIESQQPKS